MPKYLRKAARFFVGLMLVVTSVACEKSPSPPISFPEKSVLSPKLEKIFAKSKQLCFGRYVITVPVEAKLIWGNASFPSKVVALRGRSEEVKELVAADIARFRNTAKTFDLTFNGPGPVPDSWQIRYYEDDSAKRFNLHSFVTYVTKGDWVFILLGSTVAKGQEEEVAAQQAVRAAMLRLRAPDEVPQDSGFCLEHAFIADESYRIQEIVNVGVYLPSLPDVTFSISSNKDAYADYPKEEFEKMKKQELSLLARIRSAQKEQGEAYPQRTVLREGKRAVQHWDGEESLIRRPDGVHDFEWGFVGNPKDAVNPAEIIVNMYSKVEHDQVGAAKVASVSDEEALAVWDRLLAGFRFRVKVPGAPDGSYAALPAAGAGGSTQQR